MSDEQTIQAVERWGAENREAIKEVSVALNKRVDDIEAGVNRAAFGGGGAGVLGKGGANWNAERKAVAQFIRSRGQIQAGMAGDSAPDGGFTIGSTVANEIGDVMREQSPIRRLAGVQQIDQGDSFEEVISVDSAQAEWVGEREARPETTTPTLKQLTVTLREQYANPSITQRLIDDSRYDLTDWLVQTVGRAFSEKESAAFLTGDGVLMPRGLLTYPTAALDDSARPWETFEHIVTGDASGFPATDPADVLVDLVATLRAGYRPQAAWLMNRKTAAQVRKFKSSTGDYLWQDSLQVGQPDQLLGFPVTLDENMPDVAADAFPVIFGDFRLGYRIVEKEAMRTLLDPYTAKPLTMVYVYSRVGGAARDFHALKFLKVST